jgi:hypothetical protein
VKHARQAARREHTLRCDDWARGRQFELAGRVRILRRASSISCCDCWLNFREMRMLSSDASLV